MDQTLLNLEIVAACEQVRLDTLASMTLCRTGGKVVDPTAVRWGDARDDHKGPDEYICLQIRVKPDGELDTQIWHRGEYGECAKQQRNMAMAAALAHATKMAQANLDKVGSDQKANLGSHAEVSQSTLAHCGSI